MNNGSVQLPQVKVTTGTAAEYKTFLPSESNFIKQIITMNGIYSLIQLASAAPENFLFVNLAIMPSCLSLQEEIWQTFGFEIS